MTSNRPYLIRALYEWILDNDHTPYLLVNAEHEEVMVPEQFVDEGKIILNVAPQAVQDLELGNEWILFSARFSGTRFDIQIPATAVIAIYAKENGQGMIFPEEEVSSGQSSGSEPAPGKAPHLTIVK
ncbi:MAG: ClpXP protease specificity-enhancing factor [Thiotrichales bacterium]|nr:ClpXP protease specificity-enhancing factor [Thiotrichales bacterium]